MKKFTLFILLLIAFFNFTNAAPISPNTAKTVGLNFLKNQVTLANTPNISLSLSYTLGSKANNGLAKTSEVNYLYVFNINETPGFVIVAGDDKVIPILGYSDASTFNATNIPSNVQKWLDGYKAEMQYIFANNIEQTTSIAAEWNTLLNNNSSNKLGKKTGVSPLLQTNWDQSPYYNALCPLDNASSQRTVTGCVATAMAQVMKYWNYPTIGTGFHSYSHPNYGLQSANFGTTTYNWSSMPNSISSNNTAIATLMYHCGVSVDMNYDIAANGGSGAYVITNASPVTNCSEYALENYFGYSTALQGIERDNYTETNWINVMKAELNASRPVLYAGFGSGGGHCFVNDGYDNNNFFHFNWGWSGSYNGYFSINALNPGGVGTGGGSGGFNSGHQAIIGIQPPSSNPQPTNLDLSVSVTTSATSINYGASFTVTTNVTNKGTANFLGTYGAAIFDQNNVFVEFVDSLQETIGLPPNYTYSNNLTFTYPGSYTLLPGAYKAYIFYKTATTNWQQIVATNSSIAVYADFNIVYANTIEMYSNMAVTPTSLVQGQAGSVNLNLVNKGSSNFIGEYKVALFNLDGTFAENIAIISENNGLPVNYAYASPYVTFSSSNIQSPPGTYLLAVQFKESTASNFSLVGSSFYQNPIKVTVLEAPNLADAYEVNNTLAQAYALPVNFTNNTATVATTGSNCHVGNDYDYYKIVLPTGTYNYTVSARLQDLNSSNNSQTYTLDALFSYSPDGTLWSDAFDDVLPNNIQVNGGGTLYFKVSPYFTGATGTYLLDINITRNQVLSSQKDITGFSVTGMVGGAIINNTNNTVEITVNSSTNITSLIPTISVSNFASINPNSGVAQNFTNPVNYIVTAQDNTTKTWTVTVTKIAASAQKDITGFNVPGMIGGAIINTTNNTVTAVVSANTDITSLIPTISVSNFASINPNSGVPQNFTNPVNYVVTAQDNTTKNWTVTVTKFGGTAINEIPNAAQIKVYPNPSREIVNIDLGLFSAPITEIVLTNLQGKKLNAVFQLVGNNNYQINVSNLAEGVYIVQLNTEAGIVSKKLTVSK